MYIYYTVILSVCQYLFRRNNNILHYYYTVRSDIIIIYAHVIASVGLTPLPPRIRAAPHSTAERTPLQKSMQSTCSGRAWDSTNNFSSLRPSNSPIGSILKHPVNKLIAAASGNPQAAITAANRKFIKHPAEYTAACTPGGVHSVSGAEIRIPAP